MSELFAVDSHFPPALGDWPFLAMLVQTAFWVLTLICLQWIYSVVDDKKTAPAPWRSYVGMTRNVKLTLLSMAVLRTIPLLVLLNGWQRLNPNTRQFIAGASYVIYIPVAVGIAFAWWIDRRARAAEGNGRMLAFRNIELQKSEAHEKTRGIVALVLIIVVAFATTFIRSEPAHDPEPVSIVTTR